MPSKAAYIRWRREIKAVDVYLSKITFDCLLTCAEYLNNFRHKFLTCVFISPAKFDVVVSTNTTAFANSNDGQEAANNMQSRLK